MKVVEHRLDYLCEIIMGQSPSSDTYNFDGEGWPLIAGAGDFGQVYPATKKYTTKASKISQSGDIIIGIRASIADKVLSDGEYCLGRGVASLRPRPELNSRYLWHWLDTIRSELLSKSKGTTFKQVNREDISEIKIPLPPLEEQKRIAEILDCADELRALRKEAIAELDKLPQAIFYEMFGDPVVNRKGWPIKKLGEIGTLDRGISKHRPRNAPELLDGIHPLIQTGDVANCNGYIRKYQSTYSEIGLHQSKKWSKGTLCITIAANIAKTGILTFDACFPDSIVGFCANDPATIKFVRVWLSFLQKMLEETAPESAQKNINLAILRDLDVPLPPLPLQQEFAKRIEAVEELKAVHNSSLEEMNVLFASLQDRAFKGEL